MTRSAKALTTQEGTSAPGQEGEGEPLPAAPLERKQTVEAWAEELKPDKHILAGARFRNRWAEGRILTQAEFEAGVEAMGNMKVGAEHSKRGQ